MTLDDDAINLALRPDVRSRKLMGPTFWVALAFGALCILMGVVIGVYGSRIFPPAAQATDTTPVQHATSPDAIAASPTPAPAPASPPTSAEAAALSARLDHLEVGHRALADAAAAALAAAGLSQASETGRPFVNELDLLARALPDARDLAAIRPLAERGAPTRAVLVAEFPEMARQAAFAAHTPPNGASVFARASHALSALFTVRRTDQLTGNDPDAILARAERRVNDGDLDGAVHELEALPQKGQVAAKVWLDRARNRTEIQRRVAGIRLQALRQLAAADREAGL